MKLIILLCIFSKFFFLLEIIFQVNNTLTYNELLRFFNIRELQYFTPNFSHSEFTLIQQSQPKHIHSQSHIYTHI